MNITSSVGSQDAIKQLSSTFSTIRQADGATGDVEPRDGFVETHAADGSTSRSLYQQAGNNFRYFTQQTDPHGQVVKTEFAICVPDSGQLRSAHVEVNAQGQLTGGGVRSSAQDPTKAEVFEMTAPEAQSTVANLGHEFEQAWNFAPAAPTPPPTVTGTPVTTADGLQYIDVKKGDGPVAQPGQKVTVHYTGWLLDGTKFDSSRDRGTPFEFGLGQGQVIKGWDEGVAGMQVGGQRRLIIPADLGYGAQGAGNAIPPNATLVFDVELLGTQG